MRLAGGNLAIALPVGILLKLLCLKIQQDLTFSSQNSLKSVILENTMGYVDNGPPLLVKDKGTDSNEDTNIIVSCSFVINSRLTKTEDILFVRQLFSALSLHEVIINLHVCCSCCKAEINCCLFQLLEFS